MSLPRFNSGNSQLSGSYHADSPLNTDNQQTDDVSIIITTPEETKTYSANLDGDSDAKLDFGQLPSKPMTLEVHARGLTFKLSTSPCFQDTNSYEVDLVQGEDILSMLDNLEQGNLEQRPTKLSLGHPSSSLPIKDSIDVVLPINETMKDAHSKSSLRLARLKALYPDKYANIQSVYHDKDALLDDVDLDSDGVAPSYAEDDNSWCTWACSAISQSCQAVANNVVFAVKNPLQTAKSLSIAAIAGVTAAPSALNALAMPSGESPDKIGPEWWDKMSDLLKSLSVINAASSLGINFLMNKLFIPTAWNKIISTTRKEIPENLFAMLFGLGGAVAAGAIAYNAFLWMPMGYATASVPAFISFVVTLASRYIGVKNVFKRIHNWFSDDAKAQVKFADELEHIDEKYLNEIQNRFTAILENMYETCEIYSSDVEPGPDNLRSLQITANTAYVKFQDKIYYVNKLSKECTALNCVNGSIHDLPACSPKTRPLSAKELKKILDVTGHDRFSQPLTAGEFEYILEKLTSVLSDMADVHPDLIKNPTTCEYVKKYADMIFDFSFAVALIGYPAGLTFMQKGFDGVNTITKFAGGDINNINPWYKRLIGAIPGLASGMLYADSGSKFRSTVSELACYAYENPKDIPYVLIAVAANGFSATGPYNVATGVISNKDNIVGVAKDTSYAVLFNALNGVGGFVVNGTSSLYKAFLSTNKDAAHVQLQDVIKHASKVNDNLVSHRTAKRFKLFQDKLEQKSVSEPEDDLLIRAQSTFIGV